MEIMITKISFGIKEDTVKPYNDETSNSLRFGLMLSNVIFNIIIADIRPIVKIQKVT
jgi:hypothetical protein